MNGRSFEGGPFGARPPWVSIWRVAAGHEALVTKGQAGRQVDLFAAVRAGIVVSDNAGSVAGLARWTTAGSQWLDPWSRPGIGIAGQAPSISSDGTIAYLLAPAGARGTGDMTVWIRRDWGGRDRIVFRAGAARYPLMPLFGPRGELALVSIDQATKGHPDVVVLNRNAAANSIPHRGRVAGGGGERRAGDRAAGAAAHRRAAAPGGVPAKAPGRAGGVRLRGRW